MKDKFFNKIKDIAFDLSELGGRVFFVGGFVRDKFLGIESDDIDIAVEGLSFESILGVLSKHTENFTPEAVGGRFACVIADIEGYKVDFALCRSERKVGESHSEFELSFDVSIEDDLKRRDLTINAMAIDILSGELIDPFNGRDHLERGIADNVSGAFDEDPVRVIRAARFISRFNLEPTEKLKAICSQMATKVDSVPKEMVGTEFIKVVKQATNFKPFFLFLKEVGWMHPHFAEFFGKEAITDVSMLGGVGLKMISLLEILGWQYTENFLKRNKVFSEKFIKKLVCVLKEKNNVISFLKDFQNGDRFAFRKFLRRINKEGLNIKEFLFFWGLDIEQPDSWRIGIDESLIKRMMLEEFLLKPIITGDDLIFLGLKPGPQFKTVLDFCLDAQDRDELTKLNKKEFLKKMRSLLEDYKSFMDYAKGNVKKVE